MTGVWDSGKAESVKTVHILSENLRQVTKKGEFYCIRQKRNGVFSWTPVEPQPAESDVVVLHQYYAVLKSDATYKKRVSWFSSSTNIEIEKKAIYEYQGQFPTTEQPNFFRTHPATLDRMRDEIKHKRPQQIYSEQLQNND